MCKVRDIVGTIHKREDELWESPDYESPIIGFLQKCGVHVQRLRQIRYDEIKTSFREAFLPSATDEEWKHYLLDAELWHAFSCGLVSHAERTLANREFDRCEHETAYGLQLQRVSLAFDHVVDVFRWYEMKDFGKIKSEQIQGFGNFYFFSSDFSWVYVVTHEDEFGPYFASRVK